MEAVLFIGIPGAGKSTFYRERFFQTHLRISKDLLRTRHREQVFLRACLDTQQRFVVDNTNVLAEERALYLPQARAAGYRIVGYRFQSSLGEALRRNALRNEEELVPPVGVVSKYRKMQEPHWDEGFDELWSVTSTGGSSFVVVPIPVASLPALGCKEVR